MNHAEYRELFPQYAGLPDDGVVYGPHPRHKNWYKPQWNASQMLPDQNKIHEPLPRWTSANVIGDLGAYGRYQEAKKLAGIDERIVKKHSGSLHVFPHITSKDLKTLRFDALRATQEVTDTNPAFAATSVGVVAGTIYGGMTGDMWSAITIIDGVGVGAWSMYGIAEIVRRHQQTNLYADEAISVK